MRPLITVLCLISTVFAIECLIGGSSTDSKYKSHTAEYCKNTTKLCYKATRNTANSSMVVYGCDDSGTCAVASVTAGHCASNGYGGNLCCCNKDLCNSSQGLESSLLIIVGIYGMF